MGTSSVIVSSLVIMAVIIVIMGVVIAIMAVKDSREAMEDARVVGEAVVKVVETDVYNLPGTVGGYQSNDD
jgi:hypothetical protein